MFSLISLGLSEKDLTQAAIEAARSCDLLYAEFYTNTQPYSLPTLEKIFQKKITPVQRSQLEENSKKIVSEAKIQSVGLLVSGDCLAATTHLSLIQECQQKGIPYKVVHAPGILNYILNTGLQAYKFGRTVTLPAGAVPPSTLRAIHLNREAGCHTLILLDTQSAMEIPTAISLLQKDKTLFAGQKIIACHSLGLPGETIVYSTPAVLQNNPALKAKTPACLVLPGPLHFTEEEFLKQFSV